jgi:hypothetical protein
MNETLFPAVGTLPLCCLLVSHVNKLVAAEKDEAFIAMSINLYVQIVQPIVGQAFNFA